MEGPSIVILIEEAQKFVGTRVQRSTSSLDKLGAGSFKGQKLLALKSWGKHFLLVLEKVSLKVHFMMFGSYRIDMPREGRIPRLYLRFPTGELFMYACSVQRVSEPLESLYDWRTDLMSPQWSEQRAVQKLEALTLPDGTLLCDALMDQDIFAGAGNIIKNEVLLRLGLHPETPVAALSKGELRLVARTMRLYAFQFYTWKKQYLLRKNWLIFRRKYCLVCGSKVQQRPTGQLERRSFICPHCQTVPKPRSRKAATNFLKQQLTKAARQITALQRTRSEHFL